MLTTRVAAHNPVPTASSTTTTTTHDVVGDVWTRLDAEAEAGPTPPATPPSACWCRWCRCPPASQPGRRERRREGRLESRGPGPGPESEPGATTPSGCSWSLRSRRHRVSSRPEKRLFTPAIKKLLKGWLVRRRDNPYPSRAEKEALATRTGLTYLQICNWFANWRRKLRDCGRPDDEDGDLRSIPARGGEQGEESWAQLIRRYNALVAAPDCPTAQETFSISSSDSIWDGEEERLCAGTVSGSEAQQNAYVSSTTTDLETCSDVTKPCSTLEQGKVDIKKEIKQELLEEDLTGRRCEDQACSGSSLLLSKWLESAARYQPCPAPAQAHPALRRPPPGPGPPGWGIASAAVEHTLQGRHREELDAAEALTFLSSLHFQDSAA